MSACDVPIVFVLFNRPDVTAQVFEAIRRARPRQLLLVADGPRAGVPGEAETCRQTRAVVETVDWPCEVVREFSDTNLGCRRRVASGITRGFELFERTVVLEDDCVPHPDFFRYCVELLERYADDDRVMHIGGFRPHPEPTGQASSYYFVRAPLVWGWASWRRAWQRYDRDMRAYRADPGGLLARLGLSEKATGRLRRAMDRTAAGDLDTWDYQWWATILAHDGLGVVPSRNLVSNIGFDARATHTTDPHSARSARPVEGLCFPLEHPRHIAPLIHYERMILEADLGHGRKHGLFRRLTRSLLKRLRG